MLYFIDLPKSLRGLLEDVCSICDKLYRSSKAKKISIAIPMIVIAEARERQNPLNINEVQIFGGA